MQNTQKQITKLQTVEPLKQPRVLVIDDDASSRFLAEAILEAESCQVVLADNVLKAIKLLETEYIDLIVLDWLMPSQNGAQLLRHIEKNYSQSVNFVNVKRRIPLVLYTSLHPHTVELPHVTCFQLMDYWYKHEDLETIGKRAAGLIERIQRGLK